MFFMKQGVTLQDSSAPKALQKGFAVGGGLPAQAGSPPPTAGMARAAGRQ